MNPPGKGETAQRSYVLIFRQGSRKLTDEEQRKRAEEVRAWALQQIREGRGLDPRDLDAEAAILGDDASDARDRHPAIALNFIHAADFDEAVKIAKGHPGLRYGVSMRILMIVNADSDEA